MVAATSALELDRRCRRLGAPQVQRPSQSEKSALVWDIIDNYTGYHPNSSVVQITLPALISTQRALAAAQQGGSTPYGGAVTYAAAEVTTREVTKI